MPPDHVHFNGSVNRADDRSWGICTECGKGRVDRIEIPALLDLHRQIIAPAYELSQVHFERAHAA